MSDDFRIDSHKLIFHPEQVSNWLKTGDTYPTTVEISPSGACNHRCIFCAFDYLEYKPTYLEKELIIKNLGEMSKKGVKSIVVCGEGEPLLNRDTPEIINQVKAHGLDVSLVSNGVLFTAEVARECLPALSWVRFSVNAGSDQNHQQIHRSRPGDYKKILANISQAVELKRQNKWQVTIGVQMLLIQENLDYVESLGWQLKEIGVDYFTVKPFSKHPKSLFSFEGQNYDNCMYIEENLSKMNNDNFSVIFRYNAMQKISKERGYNRCWGLPFWAYIDSKAKVWACIAHIGDEAFCYGSLKEGSFIDIWEGRKRKETNDMVAKMNIDQCRELCRLDSINTYLQELKNPGLHVNFI